VTHFELKLAPWLLGSIFFLGTITASAQEVRLNAHGPSSHFGSKAGTNNGWTFGGGGEIRWEKGAWRYGVLAGGYHNSVWNLTLYAGLTGSYQITDWVALGLGVSAATGYDGDVCYKRDNGKTSCYQLSWARPITIFPLPFIALGKGVQLRVGGFSTLDSGLMHVMVSVPLRSGES
jgi:hypothetical protein